MSDFENEHLELDYPCHWEYKVIGRHYENVRQAIEDIVGGEEFRIEHSHDSAHGTYSSLNLTVLVRDEEMRLRIFQALKNHVHVHFVL